MSDTTSGAGATASHPVRRIRRWSALAIGLLLIFGCVTIVAVSATSEFSTILHRMAKSAGSGDLVDFTLYRVGNQSIRRGIATFARPDKAVTVSINDGGLVVVEQPPTTLPAIPLSKLNLHRLDLAASQTLCAGSARYATFTALSPTSHRLVVGCGPSAPIATYENYQKI